MARKISFEKACARYVHRYTMEHVPAWAQPDRGDINGRFYAPHYRSDREWYDHTIFNGEPGYIHRDLGGTDCYSTGQTWPLGQWLPEPFRKKA